jgi:hypothetical protein
VTKQLTIKYSDDREDQTVTTKDNLWDYSWPKYRKVEDCISVDAKFNSKGEVIGVNFGSEDSKNSIADIQEKIAELVLEDKNISTDEVQAHTVKNILETYSNDLEKLSLKVKKKQTKSTD